MGTRRNGETQEHNTQHVHTRRDVQKGGIFRGFVQKGGIAEKTERKGGTHNRSVEKVGIETFQKFEHKLMEFDWCFSPARTVCNCNLCHFI